MKFVQIMESTGSIEEAVAGVNDYFKNAASETKVKKISVCEDRDKPGVVIQIVEFASWDDASTNNDLEATNDAAEKVQAETNITFRNLDVHAEWDL
ncbi:MAG: hypothetical protein ACKVK3_16080 [Acidimicrobiales bacterium]|jgi:hypothetical protein